RLAPSRAARSAIARPIPRDAPLTNSVRPASERCARVTRRAPARTRLRSRIGWRWPRPLRSRVASGRRARSSAAAVEVGRALVDEGVDALGEIVERGQPSERARLGVELRGERVARRLA